MFKLPNPPSPQADSPELADFAELLAWEKGSVSAREILAYLGRIDDNDSNVGCDDDDDENAEELDEVMNEIERRGSACGGGYPFMLDLAGTVLRQIDDELDHRKLIYRYLLLSTRLNMRAHRIHANIDGANLLEEVSAEVLRSYLGRTRARSLVFGTASKQPFEEKVNSLCHDMGEGGCFRNLDTGPVDANDDKLDAVAWVPFSDKSRGQLIVFGQCKTGSNWGGLITQLQPDSFIKRWMRDPYVINPVRAFCTSEAADRARWFGTSVYGGLFLDRCRLVDFCDHLGGSLLKRVTTWCAAAKETVKLIK